MNIELALGVAHAMAWLFAAYYLLSTISTLYEAYEYQDSITALSDRLKGVKRIYRPGRPFARLCLCILVIALTW